MSPARPAEASMAPFLDSHTSLPKCVSRGSVVVVPDVGPELVGSLDQVGELGSGRVIHHFLARAWAILMCRWASLLPTPRDPECRNSQTRSCSSRLTSMK